jgi:hypothetical protein
MATKRTHGGDPKPKAGPRARPYLEQNIAILREAVVGVPHRYWNRAMSPLVQWTVYIIAVEPPANPSQLRIRLVVEARPTLRDGLAHGHDQVIGPWVRLTGLLVELEKRTKRHSPPAYYKYRKETSRKACDQLKVQGMKSSPWFLKQYLQGEELLTENVLPPRGLREPHFAPSFSPEDIVRALRSNGNVPSSLPPPSPSLPPYRTERCQLCETSFISADNQDQDKRSHDCMVLATGLACGTCGTRLCGTCCFHVSRTFVTSQALQRHRKVPWCECGLYRTPSGAIVVDEHSKVAHYAFFADAERVRSEGAAERYLPPDGRQGTYAHVLQTDLQRVLDRRLLWRAWIQCFTDSGLHYCAHPECQGATLVPLTMLAEDAAWKCTLCQHRTCTVCGELNPAPGHVCPVRRPALPLVQDEELPWARPHVVESILHTCWHYLRDRCGAIHPAGCGPCLLPVFRHASRAVPCNGCRTVREPCASAAQRVVDCTSLVAERMRAAGLTAAEGRETVESTLHALRSAKDFGDYRESEHLCRLILDAVAPDS